MTTQDTRFRYRLDDSDRVIEVDEAWCRFAAHNGAPGLEERVVNRPLWAFIEGSTVAALYRALLGRVRTHAVQATVPFRCDSPERRRFMELHLRPEDDGRLLLEGRLLREEARPPVQILDADAPRHPDELLHMCAWCKRVEEGGDWLEVEMAVARGAYFHEGPLPRITHGICPVCADRMEAAALS